MKRPAPVPAKPSAICRLDFAAFSVRKACAMTRLGQGKRRIQAPGASAGLAVALAVVLLAALPATVSAWLFCADRPPPGTPVPVPELLPAGPAMNLAPPSGPASIPNLPAPLTLPVVAALPLRRPAGGRSGNQSGRIGADRALRQRTCPRSSWALCGRVFSDRPDETGNFKLIREDRGATPR